MKFLFSLLVLCMFSVLIVPQAKSTIVVIDDTGTTITLDQRAERIISLAPSLTELLFAAGAGDKIVGVVEYSDFPPDAKSLPIIGRFDLLDVERILQLDPDLVVAWQSGNPKGSVFRLKQLGITVYTAEPKTLATIPSHIERLAILAGSELIAASAIHQFEKKINELSTRFSNKQKIATFYQVWDTPLITSGGNELINDVISLCGGQNVFTELKIVAPKVSREAVLSRNPEIIIASGMDAERPDWLNEWKRWPILTAVEKGNLFFIPPDILQRHTPRALLGAELMCNYIDHARAKIFPDS